MCYATESCPSNIRHPSCALTEQTSYTNCRRKSDGQGGLRLVFPEASFPTCTSVPPLGPDMVGFTECDIGFTEYEVGEAGYSTGAGYSDEMGSSLFNSAGMGVDGQFWGAQGPFENGMDGSFDATNITPQQIAEWASLYGW
eukprot:5631584-Amphidinium_carterae.1